MVSFVDRSFRVVPAPGGTTQVVLTTLVSTADARALADALAWLRSREHLAPALETAEAVLALRALVALHDLLEEVAASRPGAPLELAGSQLVLLTEAVARLRAEREADEGYTAPAERERARLLRDLGDRLFDAVAEHAGAEAEARAAAGR